MRTLHRKTLLGAATVAALLLAMAAAPAYQHWTGAGGYQRELRESLAHMAEESRRREEVAASRGDFEAAEAYLYCLLSLTESLDLAREQYRLRDVPQVDPQRLLAAYDVAQRLARDPASRRRLRSLEERFDDRLRELLMTRSARG